MPSYWTNRTILFAIPVWLGKMGQKPIKKTDRGSATTASPQSVSITFQNKAAMPVVLCRVQLYEIIFKRQ